VAASPPASLPPSATGGVTEVAKSPPHATHVFEIGAQAGVEPAQALVFPAVQATHWLVAALQAGVAGEPWQSPSATHATQAPVATSQTAPWCAALVAVQSELCVQRPQ
jgi:hypothetical protein